MSFFEGLGGFIGNIFTGSGTTAPQSQPYGMGQTIGGIAGQALGITPSFSLPQYYPSHVLPSYCGDCPGESTGDADFICRYCGKGVCFGCSMTHFVDGHHKKAQEQAEQLRKSVLEDYQQQVAAATQSQPSFAKGLQNSIHPQLQSQFQNTITKEKK